METKVYNRPFGQSSYISDFPSPANYVEFWRLISPHMATALLIATSWRSEAWQQACQSHHQKRWGAEGGGWCGEATERLHVPVVWFCGDGEGGEAKGKISLRKQSQWAMKEASFFRVGETQSCLPHSLLPPLRGQGQKTTASGVGGGGGCAGWWKNSQAVKGFRVFTWSGCGCWLKPQQTAQTSNPLPVCWSRR